MGLSILWEVSHDVPSLDSDKVHVWAADLDAGRSGDRELLSEDERTRADRFLDRQIGSRFTVARATLRRLLGGYLGSSPNEFRFQYGPQGKPALEGGGDLRFNVSHSHGLGLFVFIRGYEVGVDVERVEPKVVFHSWIVQVVNTGRDSGRRAILEFHNEDAARFNLKTCGYAGDVKRIVRGSTALVARGSPTLRRLRRLRTPSVPLRSPSRRPCHGRCPRHRRPRT